VWAEPSAVWSCFQSCWCSCFSLFEQESCQRHVVITTGIFVQFCWSHFSPAHHYLLLPFLLVYKCHFFVDEKVLFPRNRRINLEIWFVPIVFPFLDAVFCVFVFQLFFVKMKSNFLSIPAIPMMMVCTCVLQQLKMRFLSYTVALINHD
jgi:hypothetical protein